MPDSTATNCRADRMQTAYRGCEAAPNIFPRTLASVKPDWLRSTSNSCTASDSDAEIYNNRGRENPYSA